MLWLLFRDRFRVLMFDYELVLIVFSAVRRSRKAETDPFILWRTGCVDFVPNESCHKLYKASRKPKKFVQFGGRKNSIVVAFWRITMCVDGCSVKKWNLIDEKWWPYLFDRQCSQLYFHRLSKRKFMWNVLEIAKSRRPQVVSCLRRKLCFEIFISIQLNLVWNWLINV